MAIWTSEIKELEKLYESLKGQLPDLEKELERLVKADDENMILLYSRRCLEVIITDLCECELKRPRKTEPLQGIIDKLHKEEKVPSHIIASMHGLNELSTYGAHPKDFDPRQVRTTLINLETVIEWYQQFKGIDIKGEEAQFSGESSEEVKKETRIEEQEKPVRLTKHKFLSGVLILTILVIAGILAYPKIFKRNTLEKLRSTGERIAVAVMPFQNMTNDTTWNVWQDGIQNELITSLTNSEELKVRQTESINTLIQSKGLTNYASITPSVASKISQNLDANIFIYGSIKQVGTTIRINAQLIDSKTKDAFKSFQIDGIAENILHITDSLSLMVKNFLTISRLEKELPISYRRYGITTNSPEALKYFIYGQNAFYKKDFLTASKLFSQALTVDSNFTGAALSLSLAYANQGMDYVGFIIDQGLFDEARNLLITLHKKKDQMPLEMKIRTCRLYAIFFETPNEEIQYNKQLLELDDQLPANHGNLGSAYLDLYQYDKGIPELEKAFEILSNKWGSKPPMIDAYTSLGDAYHKTGQIKKERKIYMRAERDFPDEPELLYRQAILALSEGKTKDANEYIEKYKSIRKGQSFSEANTISNLGDIYFEAEICDKAEEYYRNALLLQPENPERMNHLAYFLINKDRNIKEGLELVDKALELSPDNYSFLDTKGWGLYKLGKYKEALDLLEKSWALKPIYVHELFLHIEEAKKAVANPK